MASYSDDLNYNEISQYLDRLLELGIVESNTNPNFCCPDCDGRYVLASVETFLKFGEAAGCLGSAVAAVPTVGHTLNTTYLSQTCGCCLHFVASNETELKLVEAYGGDPPNTDFNCSENFNSCIDLIFDSLTNNEVDEILSKGIVEFGSISGSSQLCKIYEFINQIFELEPFTTLSRAQIFEIFLDKGIVISCEGDVLVIGSVETYLKWTESVMYIP